MKPLVVGFDDRKTGSAVRGCIVNHDQLKVAPSLIENRADGAVEQGGAIEGWNDDGNNGGHNVKLLNKNR